MWRAWTAFAVAVIILGGVAQAQTSARRVALVIANANYGGAPSLPNGSADSALVRETLLRAGFAVDSRANLDRAGLLAALRSFSEISSGADVAMVYYAGHGLDVGGENWVLPIDVAPTGETSLSDQAVRMSALIGAMRGARTRLLVVDASRDNPVATRLRASGALVGRGLAPPDASIAAGMGTQSRAGAQGSLILYAAGVGAVAEEGPRGRGTPFARAFQAYFAEPDTDLRLAIGKIADAVSSDTAGRQRPFSTFSLSGAPIVLVVNAERAPPPAPARAGAEFRDCEACPLMVVVPAGRFVMGSAPGSTRFRDEAAHSVTIGRPFAAGKFEVTFAEWDACVAGGGCATAEQGPWRPKDGGWGREKRPVMNVSWWDAQRYVQWLNVQVGGRAYRLLSEAEWEYAARAGTTSTYPWGETPTSPAARDFAISPAHERRIDRTYPVGSFRSNRFGLHDMMGNVSEWVEDCGGDYSDTPVDGSAYVVAGCTLRGLRGANWDSTPPGLRFPSRATQTPIETRWNIIGFRVARSL